VGHEGRPLLGVEQMADVDLNFIAKQFERIAADVSALRDDISVLSAIMLRLDGTTTALLQEMRRMHNERNRKLEDAEG
jgi:hypothetical protein